MDLAGQQTKTYDNLPIVDALASATNNYVGVSGPAISAASADMKPTAIVDNIQDAGSKLDTIGRLKGMAVDAINNGPDQSSAPLNSPAGMRQMIADNMAKLGLVAGLSMINPALGAAAAVGVSIEEGVGYGKAPVQTAALGGQPSSFRSAADSSSSKNNKNIMPDEGGWQWGQTAAPAAPEAQAKAARVPQSQLESEQIAVNDVVASRGREQSAKQLAGISTAEDKLVQKIQAARDLALKDFGVDSPDMIVQSSSPMFGKGPAPVAALDVTPPKVRPFGGFF